MASSHLTPIELVDANWGLLTIDAEALAEKLGEATRAVYDASIAAQYRNAAGYPVSSPMAMILGGLSQVIDGLLDQLEERRKV